MPKIQQPDLIIRGNPHGVPSKLAIMFDAPPRASSVWQAQRVEQRAVGNVASTATNSRNISLPLDLLQTVLV